MFTEAQLNQFTGTTQYYRSSFGMLNLTDGVAFLMKNGAAWLVDLIESYQMKKKVHNLPFQLWEIKKTGKSAVVTMKEDSNTPIIIQQNIDYTDFPLDSLKIYVIDKVCLLTSEY